MSAEPWPTSTSATAAVEAAARKAFEVSRAEVAEATKIPVERYADWDGIGKVVQLQWRERVLPLVWAALEALPDPRHAVWEEGLHASFIDANAENPYPSGL